jgi:hypothetical protein
MGVTKISSLSHLVIPASGSICKGEEEKRCKKNIINILRVMLVL